MATHKTQQLGIYRCGVCGNVVEVLDTGAGNLLCCGQPMQLLEPRTGDSATEKHVPFVEVNGDELTVRLGQNETHPMETKHFIQWISVAAGGQVNRKFLLPNDLPNATFTVSDSAAVIVQAMCNRHGLWRSS